MKVMMWIAMLLPAIMCRAQSADTTHIFFNTDDPFLNEAAEKKIDKLAMNLQPGVRITIVGYADYRGDVYYNDMLAMRRAQSVAAKLEKNGVDKKSLKLVASKGDVHRDEEKHGGYAEDRRADIVVKHEAAVKVPEPVKPKVKPKPVAVKKEPAPTVTTENISEAEVGSTLKVDNLYFIGGRDIIKRESRKAVDDLFNILRENPRIKIQIEGHVCCTGNDEEDGTDLATGEDNLSEARAKAVYNILVSRGIYAGRLKYKGMARTKPVTRDESTQYLSDLNRRVEIRILEK